MAPCRIRSISVIILCSPDLTYQIISIIKQGFIFHINYTNEYPDLSEIHMITQFECLVVEFKLETVSAVKLLPLLTIISPELPGPVEILYTFDFLSYTFLDLVDI